MVLQTHVDIEKGSFELMPSDRILFVGSCFADNIGGRFKEHYFRATVNPYGVMYNPASILHTVERLMKEEAPALKGRSNDIGSNGIDNNSIDSNGIDSNDIGSNGMDNIANSYDVAVFTLGTNHVYILNETGEIVDNCQKRPQKLFTEKVLSVEECQGYLQRAIDLLSERNPDVKVILTVSPIRYQKYGFHESQLSKATLLMAADNLTKQSSHHPSPTFEASSSTPKPPSPNTHHPSPTTYFPAYEIMNDELRDYRFYNPDMLHPSAQAVEYIYQRFAETYFARQTWQFADEAEKVRRALNHRPINPDSAETKAFQAKAKADEQAFLAKWE